MGRENTEPSKEAVREREAHPATIVTRFFASVPVATIGFYFLATRLLIVFLGTLSAQVIQPGKFDRSTNLYDMFARWDSGWYLSIAASGYDYSATGASRVVFFPLYPLLVYLGNFIFRDPYITAYFISNLFLFSSCLVLWKLVARDYGNKAVADRAVLFLLLCPVSFFFSTIYTESTFFFFFVSLAYFAAGRRWLAAGICGYFLALSRAPGVLAVILLAVEFATQAFRRSRDQSWRVAVPAYLREEGVRFLAGIFLTVAGLASYCFYLCYKFQDPLAFEKVQAIWGRHFVVPWTFLYYDRRSHEPFYGIWFDSAFILALVLLAIGLLLRIRLSHTLIAAAFVTLYLSTSSMEATPRLLSVVFPFYIIAALAGTRWPRLEPLLFAGSAMLLMLSTILFVNGYWFT